MFANETLIYVNHDTMEQIVTSYLEKHIPDFGITQYVETVTYDVKTARFLIMVQERIEDAK